MKKTSHLAGSPAFRFVLTMGIVNLFADVTYEGGASVLGPYLGILGAGAATISIVAGIGEFLGYGLRSVSGLVGDRTGKYWQLTFIGYALNLLAVPALALAGSWPVAAALLLAERVGRAIRKPTVEAMLSYTTGELGKGWVYALNTALDEIGATIGPLLVALVVFMRGSYRTAFAILLVSAVLALGALTRARMIFPLPAELEKGRAATGRGFSRAYWLYMLAASCFAAGLMSFEFVSYHLASTKTVSAQWIPVSLALSTGCGVIASLVLGKLYDRHGLPVVLVAVVVSAAFSPLVFFGCFIPALIGLLLWGVGYATQDTLFKALIAGVLPQGKRNTAFGIFYAGYGVGWLIGSVTAGLLYESTRLGVVIFAISAQLISVPIFFAAGWVRSSESTEARA